MQLATALQGRRPPASLASLAASLLLLLLLGRRGRDARGGGAHRVSPRRRRRRRGTAVRAVAAGVERAERREHGHGRLAGTARARRDAGGRRRVPRAPNVVVGGGGGAGKIQKLTHAQSTSAASDADGVKVASKIFTLRRWLPKWKPLGGETLFSAFAIFRLVKEMRCFGTTLST